MIVPNSKTLFDDDFFRLAELSRSIKYAMNNAAGASKLSREEILDRMNQLAAKAGIKLTGGNNHGLSLDMFNKWLTINDTAYKPSIEGLIVFCKATSCLSPLSPIMLILDCDLMTSDDLRLRDLGRAYLDGKKARQRLRQIEEQL